MHELRYPTVFMLAPPFISHFRPLASLGRALKELGARVTIGCTTEFRDDIEGQGLEYSEVTINRNSNRGVATETSQAVEEQRRLKEFLDATRLGPIDTLITQARHRADDMLANPEELIHRIGRINDEKKPSLWIVDQLSYGATLALFGMDAPFATFCAPHPATIPPEGAVHSIPPAWPAGLSPKAADLARLTEVARGVEQSFTDRFNSLLDRHFGKPPVHSAFGLVSPVAVIFNYPPFPRSVPVVTRGRLIFAGHTYLEQPLPERWSERIRRGSPRVLVALGTFLSSRADVLERVVTGVRTQRPEASMFVGAGGSMEALERLRSEYVAIERFIPQRGLLPHVDLAIHHGGVSSFTETLYAGRPMIVMPFSSDQFSVARDVEDFNLGAVLDPNGFTGRELAGALDRLFSEEVQTAVAHWSAVVRARGPRYAARELQDTGGQT